jgi:hypothetical protein
MKKLNLLLLGMVAVSIIVSSCNNNNAEKTGQKDSVKTETVQTPQTKAAIDYSGNYSMADKSVCDLAIEIQKKGNGYTYVSGKAKGNVEIINQEDEVYLNFIAINGKSPKGDVEAKYENETLMIQNEGNAMNPYSIFKKCDAKYLELKKNTAGFRVEN